MRSQKKHVAFSTNSARFPARGQHPNLQSIGFLKDYPAIGPGTYTPKDQRHFPNISFTKQKESENFSKTLGYRLPDILIQRQEKQRNLSFHYEIPDFLEIRKYCRKSIRPNSDFGTVPQFYSVNKDVNPGPGTYGKYQAPSKPLCHKSTFVPPFEWDGFTKRSLVQHVRYKLPPNIYNKKDMKSIEEYVKRKVSKRGPYDVFTGPRDESTIKNHFAPSQLKGVDSWSMALPSSMDKLKHSTKQKHGCWNIEPRFTRFTTGRVIVDNLATCLRSPSDPGPGHYDAEIPSFKPTKGKVYPFDSSVKYARPRKREEIAPAVGRFNLKKLDKARSYREVFRAITRQGKPP